MAEGQTATNPQTGERVILRGGQWVPLSATPQRQPQGQQQATAPRYSGAMPSNADEIFGSLIAQESGGRAGVRGPQTRYGQALGRTQVLPDTAREIARNLGIPYREDLLTGTSPEAVAYQDRLGRAYLQEGFQRTGNAREALMYYHGGPDRSLWGPKTRQYADDVLTRWSRGEGIAPQDTAFAEPQGQAQMTAAPIGQTATNPQTGEKLSLVDGQWVPVQQGPIEVEIDQGIGNVNGRAVRFGGPNDGEDLGPWDEYWARLRRSQADRLARVEREADPQYQAAMADARAGAAAVPDRIRALALGGTLGFLTDINAEAQGALQGLENAARRFSGQEIRYGADYARQAARDAMRDEQAQYAAENPVENFVLQTAGGLLTPGLAQGGNYIAGAKGAARLARAGQIGTAYGAASGLGYGEGSLIERAPSVATNALVGAGTGAIGQAGVDRLVRGAANPATASAARRLSRQGVRLTPGQMVSETPFVGEFIRNIEDVAGGFNPLMAGVRRGQNEDVVRAAANEALGYIGESLPRNARTGYQVSQSVRRVLGDRYDDVTSRISAQADPVVYNDLQDLTLRASQTLDDGNLRRLERILNDKFINEFDASGGLSGASFKRIETALRQQSERASRPTSTLADNDLAEFIDEARDIARNLIARQHPEEADAIQALNRGWATSKIIDRAVTGSAGFSRSGTPTPGELSQAIVNSSNLGAIANENALLQGLATDARTVLPSTVPDSGTAQKTLLAGTAGVLGTGGLAAINPSLAGMIATGAVVYSRPGIAALNAVYRATDSRAASEALQELARLAQRDPALIPYYEGAVQHVLGLFQPDTPAGQPAQPATQPPSPAIQRVLQ